MLAAHALVLAIVGAVVVLLTQPTNFEVKAWRDEDHHQSYVQDSPLSGVPPLPTVLVLVLGTARAADRFSFGACRR